jgi:hypothetical protein
MKLDSQLVKEQQIMDEKIRCFKLVNGLLSLAFFVGCAITVYKIVGLFF